MSADKFKVTTKNGLKIQCKNIMSLTQFYKELQIMWRLEAHFINFYPLITLRTICNTDSSYTSVKLNVNMLADMKF